MKFLPENKQPKPYYTKKMLFVGTFEANDGLIDITDPCYDKDTWCARFDQKVKAGTYHCFVDVVNFPYKFTEGNSKEIKQSDDERIMRLTIVHQDYLDKYMYKRWKLLDSNIGVDAGMCGFYNHKPDFNDENAWQNFWENASDLPGLKWRTCDLKPYGITVSSGFGDGCYEVYRMNDKKEIIALDLRFN